MRILLLIPIVRVSHSTDSIFEIIALIAILYDTVIIVIFMRANLWAFLRIIVRILVRIVFDDIFVRLGRDDDLFRRLLFGRRLPAIDRHRDTVFKVNVQFQKQQPSFSESTVSVICPPSER